MIVFSPAIWHYGVERVKLPIQMPGKPAITELENIVHEQTLKARSDLNAGGFRPSPHHKLYYLLKKYIAVKDI